MSDRKLRLIAQISTPVAQPKDGAIGIDCADKPDSPASAEQNLRLIKAFSLIADNRRRTWLIDLVEHFARLDSATRADLP